MILGEISVDGNAQVGLTLGEGAFGVVSARGSVHRWGQLWGYNWHMESCTS